MSAFLLLLIKLNLAIAAGIILVALLRRPLRHWFGAPIAYAVWFLVPVAGFASLLPPRAADPVLVQIAPEYLPAAPVPVLGIGHSALRATEQLREQLTGHGTPLPSVIGGPTMPDTALLLFAAWALGAVLMALYLAGLQSRFSAAAQQGKAGPAVLGFLRPRIVTPADFDKHFSPREQAAILAHEQVHLARQDARINALTALLRCLCWFNPFVHLGARWLRIDQELACDATAVAEKVSRSDYAKALLKSQMMVTALPLGCNWPGPQHPLIERIALLQRKPPGSARRLAGVGLVMLAATFAGLGAWAAQPPLAAKPVAARKADTALVAPGVPSIVMSAPMTAEPAAGTSPTSKEVRKRTSATGALSPASVLRPSVRMVNISAGTQSVLAALPPITLISRPLNIDTGSEITSASTPTPPMVPNTPSGAIGDLNAIVCRAPQPIAGSGQFGPQVCLHNHEWWKLAMNGKDIAPDGETLIDKPTVDKPKGEGDPDAVTCRTPARTWLGPDRAAVCQTNRFWAGVAKNHQRVDARGRVVGGGGWGLDYGSPDFGNNAGGWVTANGTVYDSGRAWQPSGPPTTYNGSGGGITP